MRIGTALRTLRIRRRFTQADVGRKAGVSRYVVGRIERGRLGTTSIRTLRAVAAAVDARIDAIVRWQGGDLGRLLNSRHSAMHDAVARLFAGLDGWSIEPEVSFSIYGERGIIDVLAWHPARRILLVIELKTELVDMNDLMGSVDRKRRLAIEIARQRGWDPVNVSTWVVIAEGTTNRRAVAAHAATLRAKFPTDGRSVASWLRRPDGRIDGLGFLPYVSGRTVSRVVTPIRRVRRRARA
jgi:transcriptional regulator with XRE-family HTH domain